MMTHHPSPRRASGLIFAVMISVLAVVGYLGEIYLIREDATRVAVTDYTTLVVSLAAFGALLAAAIHSSRCSTRVFLAWGLIALAQLANLLADLIWIALELGFGQAPYPSVADYFYLAYYPLFLIGILILPVRSAPSIDWVKKGLDQGIVLVASILFFWNFLIGPAVSHNSGSPLLLQALGLTYPVGDLLLLWGLLVFLYGRVTHHGGLPILLLALNILVTIVTDVAFSYQTLHGTYEGGRLVDFGWFLSYVLTALAGMAQARTRFSDPGPLDPAAEHPHDLWDRVGALLPYICLSGSFTLLAISHDNELAIPFPVVVAGAGLIVVFTLARQFLAQAERQQLCGQLLQTMQQVQNQAVELQIANENLLNEIESRKRVEERLSYDALHDGLTGLPNRTLFLDRLGQAIEYSRQSTTLFSVLFIDLDSFKVVNDSLGHTIGDELLIEIAHHLCTCVRSSDTVARLGGDEFVLLLETTGDHNNVIQVADRIHSALMGRFHVKDHDVFATASLGLVVDLSRYTHPEEALRDADIAMYQAKADGKSCVAIFTPEMRSHVVQRLELETELRRALQNAEFEVYYQPIYSLFSDRIVGFEALLRWNHPTRGFLLPGEFIQVAEETGLILPMGRWVLRKACRQISQWRQAYPAFEDVTISINISGKQFKQADLVDQVSAVLKECDLPAGALRLEVTENVVIDHPEVINELFRKLCDLGVQLQVDDFGTGYSSLSYLQRFPFHSIKIDRSFIREICQPGKNSDLVYTMIRMAHDLGMDAVAEGIETEEQLVELKRLMCHYGQGFLMAKPMSESAVRELLKGGAR